MPHFLKLSSNLFLVCKLSDAEILYLLRITFSWYWTTYSYAVENLKYINNNEHFGYLIERDWKGICPLVKITH